ncbi:hypothetical protein [Actinoplanes sp. NPDC051851]|uniref:hypothetical protein n=1 Tax=Actinoplanes sp. NPDC051851 TaxID=3154753 RepID=UPI003441BF92
MPAAATRSRGEALTRLRTGTMPATTLGAVALPRGEALAALRTGAVPATHPGGAEGLTLLRAREAGGTERLALLGTRTTAADLFRTLCLLRHRPATSATTPLPGTVRSLGHARTTRSTGPPTRTGRERLTVLGTAHARGEALALLRAAHREALALLRAARREALALVGARAAIATGTARATAGTRHRTGATGIAASGLPRTAGSVRRVLMSGRVTVDLVADLVVERVAGGGGDRVGRAAPRTGLAGHHHSGSAVVAARAVTGALLRATPDDSGRALRHRAGSSGHRGCANTLRPGDHRGRNGGGSANRAAVTGADPARRGHAGLAGLRPAILRAALGVLVGPATGDPVVADHEVVRTGVGTRLTRAVLGRAAAPHRKVLARHLAGTADQAGSLRQATRPARVVRTLRTGGSPGTAGTAPRHLARTTGIALALRPGAVHPVAAGPLGGSTVDAGRSTGDRARSTALPSVGRAGDRTRETLPAVRGTRDRADRAAGHAVGLVPGPPVPAAAVPLLRRHLALLDRGATAATAAGLARDGLSAVDPALHRAGRTGLHRTGPLGTGLLARDRAGLVHRGRDHVGLVRTRRNRTGLVDTRRHRAGVLTRGALLGQPESVAGRTRR